MTARQMLLDSECQNAKSLGFGISLLYPSHLPVFPPFFCVHLPVYHTNVMMAIGTDVAVVCSESVKDERERKNLLVITGV